jgi:phage tail sheath protein FI
VFEPNTQATLDRFNALVNPILQRIQAGGGVDRYKVQIDTSTTTQADIENNTIRGKIYVQPTKTAEFISIDFVVTGRSATV